MTFEHPGGELELERWPLRKNEQLQAFDAADRLALEHCDQGAALVVNDRFGALSLGLGDRCLGLWSDSALTLAAVRHNASLNGLPAPAVVEGCLGMSPGMVMMRVPKSLELFAYQLSQVGRLPTGTSVVAAAMVKHLPHRAKELMELHLGPTQLSRAVRKARLLLSRVGEESSQVEPYHRHEATWNLELSALPGVFSAGKLDQGTRVLLEHLDKLELVGPVLDLGCGDGVLGLACLRLNDRLEVTFLDESRQAVESARLNHRANYPGLEAKFVWADGLRDYQGPPFQIILCNPPFHQEHQLADTVAWELFKGARAHLAPGGDLVVVGNRHLKYHLKLKRLFPEVECLSRDPKFVVLRARLPQEG